MSVGNVGDVGDVQDMYYTAAVHLCLQHFNILRQSGNANPEINVEVVSFRPTQRHSHFKPL